MEQQAKGSLRLIMSGIALAVSLALGATAVAQQSGQPSQERNDAGTSRAAARNQQEEAATASTRRRARSSTKRSSS
jgi:hypothetical protein